MPKISCTPCFSQSREPLEKNARPQDQAGATNPPNDPFLTNKTEGRLQQATLDLLSGCDIQFRRETRLDIALVKNLPIALIFLPAADIPTFVGEGRVDLGITGRDQVAEHDAHLTSADQSGVDELLDLGFGGCKLQVQVPQNWEVADTRELVGKNIVTSFTGLAASYFAGLEGVGDTDTGHGRSDLKTKVRYVGGSVEAACALGVADAIVDLVGTLPCQFIVVVFCTPY